MKRFLLGTVATALIAVFAQAQAADLAAPIYKAPVAVSPADLWNGWYIGAFGGDAMGGSGFGSHSTFGGYAGYNWRVGGDWLIGVEADGGTVGNGAGASAWDAQYAVAGIAVNGVPVVGAAAATLNTAQTAIDAHATLRARLGYTILPDLLVYGTVGAAGITGTTTITSTTQSAAATLGGVLVSPALTSGYQERALKLGWVGGLGAEYMVIPHVALRAEWLHADFGSVYSAKLTEDVVRGGIAYKF